MKLKMIYNFKDGSSAQVDVDEVYNSNHDFLVGLTSSKPNDIFTFTIDGESCERRIEEIKSIEIFLD